MIIFPVNKLFLNNVKYILTIALVILLFWAISRTPNASPAPTPTFKEKLAGQILIQVENNGRAWYIEPQTYQRYPINSPQDGWELFQKLSTTTDRLKWQEIKNWPPDKLTGTIVKIKEEPNIIYYFSPITKSWHKLLNSTDIFNLIKLTGRGILNKDLQKIPLAK